MKKACVVVVGCGLLFVGCTQPGETTGMAAATGGVIGAGLGAIVGSQTGDAGAGLVIGAVAGSSAGALVGNAIEAQEQTLKTQDEAIERQERVIASQRAEIEELRRLDRDVPSAGRADTTRGRFAAPRGSRASEGTVVPYAVMSPRPNGLRETTVAPAVRSAPAARAVEVTKFAPVKESTKAVESKPAPAKVVANKAPQVVERDTEAMPLDETVKETVIAAESAENLSSAQPAAADVTGALQGAHIDQAAGTECANAADEVSKAGLATDSADKLFHLRRALRLCPDNATYHNRLGEVYLTLNRRTDAEFEFREALRIDPNLDAALKNLSVLGK